MARIRREAKIAVDQAPGSRQGFIKASTRLAHYEAEEEKLITEWLDWHVRWRFEGRDILDQPTLWLAADG